MKNQRKLLPLLPISAVLLFVVWVISSSSDSEISRIVFDRGWTSLLFAIISLVSIGAFLIFLNRLMPRGMTKTGAEHWERVRMKGKGAYVWRIAVFFSTPILVGVLLAVINGARSETLDTSLTISFVGVGIIFIGAAIVVAHRNWEDNESEFRQVMSRDRDRSSSSGGVESE